ncbi:DUF2167 domain-containing protein [Reyranella sp.]|uniref:DUF2167 domain-containing protein n=1 Tax=Reyranella sp. TaxID=1929291 RepID=UPI0037849D40
MLNAVRLPFVTLATILFANVSLAQESALMRDISALPWQKAPATCNIGTVARISLTGNLRCLDSASSSKFVELNGNPPRQNTYVLAPWPLAWFSVFVFDPSGYVRDDEKLEADSLLSVLKQQNEKGAEERRRLNLPVMRLTGWAIEPHYDLQTKRLEWGTRFVVDATGEETVNYTIRILGRSGVMSAVLVADPANLKTDIQALRAALTGFDFVTGERYSEYRQGDKTAEYGLAALIVGGAAAAAAKSGALKGFGKLILFGGIGLLAVAGAFFRRLFGRQKSQ